MKKSLIGLLMLGSISSFAGEVYKCSNQEDVLYFDLTQASYITLGENAQTSCSLESEESLIYTCPLQHLETDASGQTSVSVVNTAFEINKDEMTLRVYDTLRGVQTLYCVD